MSKISKMNSKASETEIMTQIIKIVIYRSCLKKAERRPHAHRSAFLSNKATYTSYTSEINHFAVAALISTSSIEHLTGVLDGTQSLYPDTLNAR